MSTRLGWAGPVIHIGHQHRIAVAGHALRHVEQRLPQAQPVHIEDDGGLRRLAIGVEEMRVDSAVLGPDLQRRRGHDRSSPVRLDCPFRLTDDVLARPRLAQGLQDGLGTRRVQQFRHRRLDLAPPVRPLVAGPRQVDRDPLAGQIVGLGDDEGRAGAGDIGMGRRHHGGGVELGLLTRIGSSRNLPRPAPRPRRPSRPREWSAPHPMSPSG